MPSHNVSYPSTAQRRWWGIYTALYLVGVLWLLLGISRPAHDYDDGIPVVGAIRILDGELPYRDFYANYSAGQFYLTAAAFGLTGPSLLIQRMLSILVRALIALTAFALMRRLAPLSVAVGGWVLFLAWLAFFGLFGYTAFPALLLSLVSLLFMWRALERRSSTGLLGSGGLIASGLAAGLAFLFRQDFGVYVGFTQIVLLSAYSLAPRPMRWDRARFRQLARNAILLAAGALAVLIGPGIFFAKQLGPGELFHTLFVWPYELTRSFRGLVYPRPWAPLESYAGGWGGVTGLLRGIRETLPFTLPVVIYPIVGWQLMKQWWVERCPSSPQFWMRVALLVFGVLTFNQVLHVSDVVHLFPTLFVAFLLLSTPLGAWIGSRRRKPQQMGLVGLATLFLLAPPMGVLGLAIQPWSAQLPRATHSAPRARGIPVSQDQLAALEYIWDHTARDEPIFVGNGGHDRIWWNDIIFYFLAERPIATRYHHFDPGMTTTPEIQQEIIGELERNDVEYVVLFFANQVMPAANSKAVPGSTLLDEYIRSHYETVHSFGRYEIRRRDASSV